MHETSPINSMPNQIFDIRDYSKSSWPTMEGLQRKTTSHIPKMRKADSFTLQNRVIVMPWVQTIRFHSDTILSKSTPTPIHTNQVLLQDRVIWKPFVHPPSMLLALMRMRNEHLDQIQTDLSTNWSIVHSVRVWCIIWEAVQAIFKGGDKQLK